MKFAGRNNIGELATWNSAQVEVVDDEMKEYSDLLIMDKEQEGWDNIVMWRNPCLCNRVDRTMTDLDWLKDRSGLIKAKTGLNQSIDRL